MHIQVLWTLRILQTISKTAPPKPPDPPRDPYRDCSVYIENACGSSRYGKYEFDELVDLGELEKNSVDDYFTNYLHIKDSLLTSLWNEKRLILNRV